MLSVFQKSVLLVLTLGVFSSSVATAEPGAGLRAGNLKVSPGLTLSTLYDSNVFFQSTDEAVSLSNAPSLQVQPFLTMETMNAKLTQVTLDARLAWQQYLASETNLSEQSGLSATVAGELGINRRGAFSVSLKERFTRTNEAPNLPADFPFNRDINSLGVTFGLHPGDQVFQHYLTYSWLIYNHENIEIEALDRQTHHLTLANNWRFLPRTALSLTGDVQFVRYTSNVSTGNLSTNNSTPVRLTGGITGSLTNRIGVRLLAGWGWGFYETGPTSSDFLADLRVSWKFGQLSSNSSLFIGYSQGFGDSTIANYYSYYKPYAGYSQTLADRLTLKADVSMQFRTYPGTDFDDSLLNVSAGVGFALAKWWSLDLNYNLQSNFTEDSVEITTVGDEALRAYTRHLVSLSTTIHY